MDFAFDIRGIYDAPVVVLDVLQHRVGQQFDMPDQTAGVHPDPFDGLAGEPDLRIIPIGRREHLFHFVLGNQPHFDNIGPKTLEELTDAAVSGPVTQQVFGAAEDKMNGLLTAGRAEHIAQHLEEVAVQRSLPLHRGKEVVHLVQHENQALSRHVLELLVEQLQFFRGAVRRGIRGHLPVLTKLLPILALAVRGVSALNCVQNPVDEQGLHKPGACVVQAVHLDRDGVLTAQ